MTHAVSDVIYDSTWVFYIMHAAIYHNYRTSKNHDKWRAEVPVDYEEDDYNYKMQVVQLIRNEDSMSAAVC